MITESTEYYLRKDIEIALKSEAMGFARGIEAAAAVADSYEPRCDVCPRGCADAIRALLGKEP